MSTSSRNKNLDDNGKIAIGYVSSAHGIRGEFRVVPLTDFPERFWQMDTLTLYLNGCFVRTLRIVRVREHGSKGELIFESDLPDRNEAERLIGASIMIAPQERVDLPDDRFWIDDLIGLRVCDSEGITLGFVTDFISAGGNDVYEITDEQSKPHYIPAVGEFVKDIDLSAKVMSVKLIDGLW